MCEWMCGAQSSCTVVRVGSLIVASFSLSVPNISYSSVVCRGSGLESGGGNGGGGSIGKGGWCGIIVLLLVSCLAGGGDLVLSVVPLVYGSVGDSGMSSCLVGCAGVLGFSGLWIGSGGSIWG